LKNELEKEKSVKTRAIEILKLVKDKKVEVYIDDFLKHNKI